MALQRRQLEVLVAVDEAGSIHRAAEQLGIGQPAVSRTIGEVERSIGALLFERSADGTIPTPRGESLVGQARSILRSLERLDAVAGAHAGPVRLGCIPQAMHALMPRLLAKQSSLAASRRRLEVIEGDSVRLWHALQRGELDFAVMRRVEGASDWRRPLVARPLYAERSLVVADAAESGRPRCRPALCWPRRGAPDPQERRSVAFCYRAGAVATATVTATAAAPAPGWRRWMPRTGRAQSRIRRRRRRRS